MGDSSSILRKRATKNYDDGETNKKKPNIMPASKGSTLQPQYTAHSDIRFLLWEHEEFYVKEAHRFLVLKGQTTLATRIIFRSDLKKLPTYLLREFENKNWYYNHDLQGTYDEYQRLCIAKKSCSSYGLYQTLAQGLQNDLTYYSFYKCANQIEWISHKEDISGQAWKLHGTFEIIDYSYITNYINVNASLALSQLIHCWKLYMSSVFHQYSYLKYQTELKFQEEKAGLLCELWNEVALKGRNFYEVVRSIYKTMKATKSAQENLVRLDLDKKQCHGYLKTAISKGEESERTISEYFEMLKPKRKVDYAKYIKAKIHMAMDLGIISESDLSCVPEGIQFLKEDGTRKEGDTDLLCSCLNCFQLSLPSSNHDER